MKKLSYLFTALAIVLSDIMCFVVAYHYRDMLCGIRLALGSSYVRLWHIRFIKNNIKRPLPGGKGLKLD